MYYISKFPIHLRHTCWPHTANWCTWSHNFFFFHYFIWKVKHKNMTFLYFQFIKDWLFFFCSNLNLNEKATSLSLQKRKPPFRVSLHEKSTFEEKKTTSGAHKITQKTHTHNAQLIINKWWYVYPRFSAYPHTARKNVRK